MGAAMQPLQSRPRCWSSPRDDDLVASGMAHDNRVARACTLVELVALAGGVLGQVDRGLEALQLIAVAGAIVSRGLFRMRKSHPCPPPAGLLQLGRDRSLLFRIGIGRTGIEAGGRGLDRRSKT